MYVCTYVCAYMYAYIYVCINIYNIYETNVKHQNVKLNQQVGLLSKPYGVHYFLYCKFHLLTYLFFSFYSNKFIAFYRLIKCHNIVGKTCGN